MSCYVFWIKHYIFIVTANLKAKSENENERNEDPMDGENNAGDRVVCTDVELKKLAECVKEYWRKMIPKLGLTQENLKSFEENKSEETGA